MHGLIKLGMYLPFIFIACIEVVFALFLFWKISKGKSHSEVSANFNGHLDFAQFLNQSKDTAYVILNRKDQMPIAAFGNLQGLLGCDLKEIQDDLYNLQRNFLDIKENRNLMNEYFAWDGKRKRRIDC